MSKVIKNIGDVKTRFAPSPTGLLHIGGARTALFNWLFARSHSGKFFLRIEDTDLERSKQEYEEEIKSSLKWMGLDWDNRDKIIRQSERFTLYQTVAESLVEKGAAYKCYENAKYAIRFKMPKELKFTIKDYIMGDIDIDCSKLDDFVLTRSDKTATYMLASVVDDELMGITHVIRGSEHLPNTFRQQPLLAALGYKIPQYVHLPLIHNLDGQKLSKREGAAGVVDYIKMGILPEAFCNYILRLGWGYGNTEIISMEDVVKIFDLSQLGTSPAKIDPQKLMWLNAHYMRSLTDIRTRLGENLPKISEECLENILEKSNTLNQARGAIETIFSKLEVEQIDNIVSLTPEEENFINKTNLDTSSAERCKVSIMSAIKAAGLNSKRILMFYRIALTGMKISPGLFEVMSNLSNDTISYRVKKAMNSFKRG